MLDRVLVLSASAGAGHLRAAQAVERAFLESGAAREVRHVDTLDYTNKIFRRLYSKAYIDMVNHAPEVLGWLYDYLDEPWERERRRLFVDKFNAGPFVKMLERHQPDVVVCTHFLPSEIISWLKAKGRARFPQAIVVTDFDVHAMWLCRNVDHYFVAIEETRVHLEKLGISREKVTVTGIPIDPAFSRLPSKNEARERLGLDRERPVILLSAGGFGVGPIERLVSSLFELERPAQFVAIAGRNEELRARLEQLAAAAAASRHRLVPVGFTTDMQTYMAASDILLGKPGGLTTSEALASGLAFAIVNPIPGQEERNSDHLLEDGVAIRCNNLPALPFKVDRLLADPKRLAAMQAASRALGRPRAAFDVAEKVASLVTPRAATAGA